ncbi:ABC transporter ATP-binding protein [Methylocapsa sp. S129]|uniref:ABC transporter ATP-binding protein n=1 Tax=Methylocapsa sp. S129 TaxID=1641869 RepID=UPI00131B5D28|nr:ABC transporter ATP-binding protein [Methylocapsa sp. S129]
MAHINLRDASVEIPVYAVGNNSLKTMLLRKAVGGRFGRSGSNVIITALSGIDLDIHDGERIGLVGHNGSGKTSLLRVLAGVYPPTKGEVNVVGRVSPMFDISLGMSVDATGIENIKICGALWGLSKQEIEAGIDDIVDFTELGDYLNIPVRTYSAGMLLRLSFAIATLRQPEILLLDEVIGVGDAEFMKKAEGRLEKIASRANILVVSSHSDDIIRRLCTKAIWLNQGVVGAFGEVESVLSAYHAG